MTATPEPALPDVLSALRQSHQRFVGAVSPLTDAQVNGRSYDDDWTIAQVASHLGSGAQIFGLFVDAGVRQASAPGVEQLTPVWDAWNAKPPSLQAADALVADAAFLDQLDALSAGDRARWQLDLFGTQLSLADLLRMRLAEHALHTWDIAVAFDPAATVAADAAALIIDNLSMIVERAGKGGPDPVTASVITSSPDRRFRLELTTGSARLAPSTGAADAPASLRLPGEAFIRLVYGRLDDGHTPAAARAQGVELDVLRRAFPGV